MEDKKQAKAVKRSKLPRVIFYQDEKNDEFSTAQIDAKKIDGSYKYERTKGLSRIPHIFWYRMVAVPLAFFYLKIKFKHKIIGKEKLKPYKKNGAFFYGNHTQIIGDALIPTFVCFPEDAFVIVHANNVSMPYLGKINPYLGALPLPDDMAATRNFTEIIKKRIDEKKNIFIYPEAHIWPYYTKIRPFGDESFMYPVKHNTPVFCFTNTYIKKGKKEHPAIVTYVDGPFFPDGECSPRARRQKLRDAVYETMCRRAENSDAVWIEYRRAGETEQKEAEKKEDNL